MRGSFRLMVVTAASPRAGDVAKRNSQSTLSDLGRLFSRLNAGAALSGS